MKIGCFIKGGEGLFERVVTPNEGNPVTGKRTPHPQNIGGQEKKNGGGDS